MPKIKELFDGQVGQDLFKELTVPNPKKRLRAIVAFKKIIQKKLATV